MEQRRKVRHDDDGAEPLPRDFAPPIPEIAVALDGAEPLPRDYVPLPTLVPLAEVATLSHDGAGRHLPPERAEMHVPAACAEFRPKQRSGPLSRWCSLCTRHEHEHPVAPCKSAPAAPTSMPSMPREKSSAARGKTCKTFAPKRADGPLRLHCATCGCHLSHHATSALCPGFFPKAPTGALRRWCAICDGHEGRHETAHAAWLLGAVTPMLRPAAARAPKPCRAFAPQREKGPVRLTCVSCGWHVADHSVSACQAHDDRARQRTQGRWRPMCGA